jgi:hypothetical protein
MTNKQRIYCRSLGNKQGTILVAGPDQSEVKWDDGRVSIVPNDWLTPARIERVRLHPKQTET